MKKGSRRRLTAFLTCLIILASAFVVHGAEIESVETNLPDINVKIHSDGGKDNDLEASDIKATLDGQPLSVGEAKVDGKAVEWIFMLDTSVSMTIKEFNAQKSAILNVFDRRGKDDKISVYVFDVDIRKVLDGSETHDEAAKKLDALRCDGTDTVFYDAIAKVSDLADKSECDTVIPVIFTDGGDTTSKTSLDSAKKKLASAKVPVNGYYPENCTLGKPSLLKEMVESSGGEYGVAGVKNVNEKLDGFRPESEISLVLKAKEDVAANDKGELVIDIGNGEPLKKAVSVEAWKKDSVKPEIVSVETDTENKTVTISFSEDVSGAQYAANYHFACSNGQAPVISSVRCPDEKTAVITVDSLEAKGIILSVKGISDLSGNLADSKSFDVESAKHFNSLPLIIMLLVIFALILLVFFMRRRSDENPEKVKKEKTAKPKKEKPEKPEKVKKEKAEKPEKVKKEKPAKPEKVKKEKPTKPEKVKKEKPAKPEKVKKEKPEKPAKVKKEKPEKPEKAKKEKPAKEKKQKPEKTKKEKPKAEKDQKTSEAKRKKTEKAWDEKAEKRKLNEEKEKARAEAERLKAEEKKKREFEKQEAAKKAKAEKEKLQIEKDKKAEQEKVNKAWAKADKEKAKADAKLRKEEQKKAKAEAAAEKKAEANHQTKPKQKGAIAFQADTKKKKKPAKFKPAKATVPKSTTDKAALAAEKKERARLAKEQAAAEKEARKRAQALSGERKYKSDYLEAQRYKFYFEGDAADTKKSQQNSDKKDDDQ